jgi:hypothetical protein
MFELNRKGMPELNQQGKFARRTWGPCTFVCPELVESLRPMQLTSITTSKALTLMIAVVMALVLGVAGCASSSTAEDSSADSSAVSPGPPQIPERTLSLTEISELSMSSEAKGALYEGFPIQLPVMDGEVIGAAPLPVEGGGEWTYEILVVEPFEVVFEWYSRAYPIASWRIIELRTVSGSNGEPGVYLQFGKGNALSRITILPKGDSTSVEAGITIGADAAVEL